MGAEEKRKAGEARPGKVWLVGAGPGDPGLITVKGKQCIAEADVIIYDSLANPTLLDGARPDCEVLYAGKRAGRHSMKQPEISALVAEKALEGKRVCRLKGGDPFVFGRGGEEALLLRKRGVPFEVVPGVTSAVAAPAYAGIPVTHRGHAASFRVITGHEDPTKPRSDLDWAEIAASCGTLVFLMGVRNLPEIARRLIDGGRPSTTPAALIANGTLPSQRTVVATLEDIAGRAEQEGLAPPALLVVGEVASLRDELAWFEDRPLFGRSIVVTRARAQASEFAAALEERGAEVIQAPTIRVESLADTPEMREAVHSLHEVQWVVFLSVNGVDTFIEALELEGLDVRALAGVGIAAVGSTTVKRLEASGLRADVVPDRFSGEAVIEALAAKEGGEHPPLSPFKGGLQEHPPLSPFQGGIEGQTVLLPRPDIAPRALPDALRKRGARVVEVTAYRTVPGDELSEELIARIERDEIDLVTFTSSSTVRNFVDGLPEDRRTELLGHVRAASIGPATTMTLEEMGIPPVVEAEVSTIPGLTAAIEEFFKI